MSRSIGVAHARAGLLGNPSDGYGGKAIAVSVGDFRAQVTVEPAERLEIAPGDTDLLAFDSLDDAHNVLSKRGCEDGLRLIRATLVEFVDHCRREGLDLAKDDEHQHFRVRYETNVPIQVGLSGSSAIVIAALRALMSWFGATIESSVVAELALSVEVNRLGLAGGPMDRVIQAYEGLMLMDLQEPRTEASYRRLDPTLLPALFIAWDPGGGDPSSAVHGDLRARWDAGDAELQRIMQSFRPLVDEGAAALEAGDHGRFRELMRRNFELRARFFPISETDRAKVEIAEAGGAVAKLCGSGGAVVGSAESAQQIEEIGAAYRDSGFEWIPLQVPE